jgi:glycosyltransferase involved in cell wall biosynthesis
VQRDAGPDLPITVLPLAIPKLPAMIAVDDGGPPWIVSPGWIDPVKRPDDLVRMLAGLRAMTPARLAFVGEAKDVQREALAALAAELGCADAVTITGFVDDAEYRMWLARASCVVLLRQRAHGEGSAALADAIGASRPVITSLSTAAELPDGVVELVDPDVPVATLITKVRRMLVDPIHSGMLTRTAAAYADAWRMEHVATRVLEAALAAPRPSYPHPLVPVAP